MPKKPQKSRRRLVILIKSLCIVLTLANLSLLVAGSILTDRIIAKEAVGVSDSNTQFNLWNFIPGATELITGNQKTLKGQDIGRTNILVIGTDPDNGLTDSLMIASYFWESKKMVTVNLPRDLYVSIPGFASEKINAVYPLARGLKPGDPNYGAQFLSKFVQDEFGLNIDYWAVTNVDGLRQMVDLVGGVEVNVENAFTDFEFPTDGYTGYMNPAPSFAQGLVKLSGVRASIYARSRHGAGGEGSDFARSRRQSIVVEALLKKIKEQDIAGNITKINSFLNILNKNIRTNMQPQEMLSLASEFKSFSFGSSFLRAIWFSGNGFLCTPTDTGQGYIITYGDSNNCGNILPGNGRTSIYRTKAKDFLSNLLEQGQKDLLNRSSILVVGNQNPLTNKVYNDLINNDLTQVQQNNNSKTLVIPTKNAVSKAIVYIPNTAVFDLFSSIKSQFTVEMEIKNEAWPATITSVVGTADPAILVVVE